MYVYIVPTELAPCTWQSDDAAMATTQLKNRLKDLMTTVQTS